jgi:hypothetical protein
MIKKLFFLAALLAPGLAYAANPSADLSVQVVPAGKTTTSTQCPSTAPAEAQKAGFTTMVLCEDFTQALPNTAGTGTTTNWMGCASGPGQIWYFAGAQPGCGNFKQEIDPTTGQLTMHIQFLRSQWHSDPNNSWGWNQIVTDDQSSHTPGVGNYFAFPQASLMEITVRDNISALENPNGCNSSAEEGIFVTTHEAVAGTGFNEYDILEHWNGGTPGTCASFLIDAGLHNWNSGNKYAGCLWDGYSGGGGCNPSGVLPPGMQGNNNWTDSYHTYGILTTTDGSATLEACGYIDHHLASCQQFPGGAANQCSLGGPGTIGNSNGSGCYGQRNILDLTVGSYGPQMVADEHDYIETIRVWSCPAWNAGGNPHISNPGVNTCYGSVITGENAVGPTIDLADVPSQALHRLSSIMAPGRP